MRPFRLGHRIFLIVNSPCRDPHSWTSRPLTFLLPLGMGPFRSPEVTQGTILELTDTCPIRPKLSLNSNFAFFPLASDCGFRGYFILNFRDAGLSNDIVFVVFDLLCRQTSLEAAIFLGKH